MDGLERITSITSLNSVSSLRALFAGRRKEAALNCKQEKTEVAVAVARLLHRSKDTLTRLDLRCLDAQRAVLYLYSIKQTVFEAQKLKGA